MKMGMARRLPGSAVFVASALLWSAAFGAQRAQAETTEESHVVDCLTDEPQTIDELAQACAWPSQRVLTVLTTLELRRAVCRLPGQQYVKV